MLRSMESLTVSFGLVNVPVKMYAAAESASGLGFHMLCAAHQSRVEQQYVCKAHKEVVPRDAMVKGYEYAKDRYVTFTADEVKALGEASSPALDVEAFVPAGSVDPLYYDGRYFLAPDKAGERGFALLAAAMRKTGRNALAKYAARGRSYMVEIRPLDEGLVMHTLLYADEVRSIKDTPQANAPVKDAELDLAVALIEQSAAEAFEPVATDPVKARVQQQIGARVAGKPITVEEEPKAGAPVVDLLAALKASVEKKAGGGSARKPAKKAVRKTA